VLFLIKGIDWPFSFNFRFNAIFFGLDLGEATCNYCLSAIALEVFLLEFNAAFS